MKASPLAVTKEKFKSKQGLVDSVRKLMTNDLWIDRLNEDKGLEHVSNRKLLHLHALLSDVSKQFGSREKLVDAILKHQGREKDGDYRDKLKSVSTPKLWSTYQALQKRADQKRS